MPDPPALPYLFLEQPWYIFTALFASAIVLLIVARRRAQRGPAIAAGVALLLAVGVVVLATLVTTDRERIIQRTEQLVMATAPLDVAKMDALIEPHAALSGHDGRFWYEYQQVSTVLQEVIQRFGVGSQGVRELRAGLTHPDRAVSRFHARTTLADTGAPIHTAWSLTWQKRPDGTWRVEDIRWLEFQNRPPTEGMWR